MNTPLTTTREKREWWAIDESGDVLKATGYSCAPENPTSWWVPQLGYTGNEAHHLFKTEKQALKKAIEAAEADFVSAAKRVSRLRARFSKTK